MKSFLLLSFVFFQNVCGAEMLSKYDIQKNTLNALHDNLSQSLQTLPGGPYQISGRINTGFAESWFNPFVAGLRARGYYDMGLVSVKEVDFQVINNNGGQIYNINCNLEITLEANNSCEAWLGSPTGISTCKVTPQNNALREKMYIRIKDIACTK